MLPWIPTKRVLACIVGVLAIGFGALALSDDEIAGTPLALAGLGTAAEEPPATADPQGPNRFERRARPDHLDVATPAQMARARREAQATEAAPPPSPPKIVRASDPGPMPPASAGSNGSYTPRPRTADAKTTPGLAARLGDGLDGDSAILINGIALAPPDAPKRVQAAITAANEIVNRPYLWGGGHGSWASDGYDCSGAVSYSLGAGGFLGQPLDSSGLAAWGDTGPGRWITIYANAGHAYAEIAGLRFDTSGNASGTGPRWHLDDADPSGFVERHPPGY